MGRAAVSFFLLALAQGTFAQYPGKPIRLVVPFPARESVDATARPEASDDVSSRGQRPRDLLQHIVPAEIPRVPLGMTT